VSAAVVLFTRDLRVHDHPGLAAAAHEHDAVLPLFVFDDRLVRRAGAARQAFLHGALADLRASLREAGADLLVRRGDPVAEAARLARAHDARAVYVADDASAYAQRRLKGLEAARLDVRRHTGIAAVAPGALTPAGRDHYRVFTPYWRRWREEPAAAVLAPPARLRLPDGVAGGSLPAGNGTGGERRAPPARRLAGARRPRIRRGSGCAGGRCDVASEPVPALRVRLGERGGRSRARRRPRCRRVRAAAVLARLLSAAACCESHARDG
jgi:deoxyribodipyrimidine photo-lyase